MWFTLWLSCSSHFKYLTQMFLWINITYSVCIATHEYPETKGRGRKNRCNFRIFLIWQLAAAKHVKSEIWWNPLLGPMFSCKVICRCRSHMTSYTIYLVIKARLLAQSKQVADVPKKCFSPTLSFHSVYCLLSTENKSEEESFHWLLGGGATVANRVSHYLLPVGKWEHCL